MVKTGWHPESNPRARPPFGVAAGLMVVGLTACGAAPSRPTGDQVVQEKLARCWRAATRSSPSGPPYSDEEARNRMTRATGVIPVGQARPLRDVLKALEVDPGRLRDRWVECVHKAYIERWRLSESYDVEWWRQAPDCCSPMQGDCYDIHAIRVTPRR